ncbi:MAG: hypothetical protein ACLRFM_00575 [Alphaproteobacteria bacterium]
MKIRNLAFCGVMASILGVSGAYAANDATIIASKAYVDAKDSLKQNEANRYQIGSGTWASVSNDDKSSDEKYPSMKTLNAAIDGTLTSQTESSNVLGSSNTTYLPTVGAVQAAASSTATATYSNGTVTVASGDNTHVPTTGAVQSGLNALKSAVENTTEANIVATAADSAKLVKGQAIQDGVQYLKGTGIASITADIAEGRDANQLHNETVLTGAQTAWNTTLNNRKSDTYVPTVAAVEARVAKAEADAIANVPKETNNVVTSTNTNRLPTVASVQGGIAKQGDSTKNWTDVTDDTKGTSVNLLEAKTAGDSYVPTVAAVEKRIDDETSSMTDSTASATYDSTNGIAIAVANGAGNQGKFATSAAVASTANALKDAIVATNTTVAGLDLASDQATGTGEAVVTVTQTDGQIAVAKDKLSFSGAMKSGLSEINTVGGDYSVNCTTGNPCVLTMVMDNGTPTYEWTSMDTDSLTGQI